MKHASEYLLYGRFGHRYDMHTPNYHYQHDHDFIIKEIQKTWRSARVLDIGCGSGVFLEKALQAGLDPVGLDPAAAMLGLACEKVGEERVYLMGMQDLEFQQEFHAIVSLSWVLNYAANVSELKDILRRIKLALLPGGRVFFQVAHALHAPKVLSDYSVDMVPGLDDSQNIIFKYRFATLDAETMMAQYKFYCHSDSEYFEEKHILRVADAKLVANILRDLGFQNVLLLEDYRCQPFEKTLSPFVIANLPD